MEFNFDLWVAKNGLQQIKHLLVKHKATTVDVLNITSLQFQSLLTDNQLPRHLLPKIMVAIQKIPQSKHRVVITETEETAMDNAEKEWNKIVSDIQTFDQLIKNTQNNHQQCERQIKLQFDSVVHALRMREKALLNKLDAVKKHKMDVFQNQSYSLKCFGKKYSDTKNKWEEILSQQNVDKNQRKQTITATTNKFVEIAQDLRKKNKMMLGMVTDQLDVTFTSYQSFVAGFGDVYMDKCFVIPVIIPLRIGSRNAEFGIQCDDANFSENTDHVYRVELRTKDDNDAKENEQWIVMDFNSNPIAIEKLAPNTKYGIRCNIKYENHIVSKRSKTHYFTTDKVEVFEIRRGNISNEPNWKYDGKVNAISFVSSKNITIYGIGVFDCKGTVKAKYELFQENDDKTRVHLSGSKEATFVRGAVKKTPIRLDLDAPVNLDADRKYTIELKQENNGSGSYFVDPAHDKVTVNKVSITFLNAPSCSDMNSGTVPVLYCSL